MILFIASEVMFFVGWFWAWFDFSLFPVPVEIVDGAVTSLFGQDGAAAITVWPPKGIHVIDAFSLPLLNTLILLCSGTTITWAHHSLIHGDREGLKKGLWATIILGLLFRFHVLVGTIFLIVCLVRTYKGHFTPTQHFGFEAAAWYWHFVDVVWLFLFIIVYVWGGWGAPVAAH
jgi:cytochrome c oxidase subunit 3